jgi:hypothetical protein
MSRGLHFERLSSGVQLFAVWLAAVALGNLLRRALALEGPRLRAAAVMGLVAVFLGPMLAERTRAAVRNGELVASGKMRFDADVREFAPILERLRTEPPGRVYAGRRGDWGESYRLGDVPVYQLLSALAIPDVGNAPFSWAPTTDFQMDGGEPSLGLFDARYVVADRPELAPPRGELLFVSGRHRLWRVAAEGPFSIVAAPFTIAGGHDRAWYLERLWLAGRWPGARALPRLDLDGGAAAGPVLRALDPLHDVLPGEAEARYVFDLPGPFEAEPPAPARGTIAGAEVARGEARARVTLETPGTVLFKTTWHPCWTATVDGAPAPVAALVPGLMGVDVPAGEHELRLAYRPGWLKAALAAAGLVLAVLLDLGRGARRA